MIELITAPDVIPLLRAACPSYESRWHEYVSEPSYKPGYLHLDLRDFAHHLVNVTRTATRDELLPFFRAIETLLERGDAAVREATVANILGGIQYFTVHAGLYPHTLGAFLGPLSKRGRDELGARMVLSNHVIGVALFLRTCSAEEVDDFLRVYGAWGEGGYWSINEEGIQKIDFLGGPWKALDEVKSHYYAFLDWEPAYFADVYVKGHEREASEASLRRLVTALLSTFGGLVMTRTWQATPDVFSLQDVQAGANSQGVRFLVDTP